MILTTLTTLTTLLTLTIGPEYVANPPLPGFIVERPCYLVDLACSDVGLVGVGRVVRVVALLGVVGGK